VEAEQDKPEDKTNPVNRSSRERSEVTNEVYNQLTLRLADADTKITSARNKVEDARQELTDLEKKSTEGPRVEAEYTALTRGYQVMKGNYESLLTRRESARIGEAADSSADAVQFRIVAEPEEPALPTGPKRRIFNIAAFILGIAAGCGLVIVMAKLQDCVTTPDDLAEFTDHIVLGTVSKATTLALPLPFYKRHAGFTWGTASLAFTGFISIALAPNFSTIPGAIMIRLASL
jgi:hypothetical protein